MAVIEILIVLAAIAALVFMITEYDRLLARTYAAAMFLPVTVSALLLPEALDISFFRKKWWICFLIVPVCFFMGMLEQQQKLKVGALDISSMGVKRQAEEYAIAHHGNIYIYDNSMVLPGDPFVTYPDTKPNNLIFWGGSGMYSPPYYEQLESLGLDELYPPQFFDENVCFIGAKEPSPVLEEYMYNRFPGSSCVITDETDSFIVYRFIR